MKPSTIGWLFSAVFLSGWFVFYNIFVEKMALFTATWQGVLAGAGGTLLSAIFTAIYLRHLRKKRDAHS